MSADPYLSEIQLFAFDFPPKGWAHCSGQLLPINQNQALFSLLGTTYGGNGQTNFALPDLRGRAAMHEGAGHYLGERSGAEFVTLTTIELPAHTHTIDVSGMTLTARARNAAANQRRRWQVSRGRGRSGLVYSQAAADANMGAPVWPSPAPRPQQHWRRPAARQPPAVSRLELLHFSPGNFPSQT